MILILLWAIFNTSFSQALKFEQLSPALQVEFKNRAATYRTTPFSYNSVEKTVKQMGLDFSSMPIEDAIMLMFQLIADDARNDMREQLEEMNATRLKRQGLREKEDLLKKELDSLRDRAREHFDSMPGNQKQIQIRQISSEHRLTVAEEYRIIDKKKATQIRLNTVEA